MTMPSIVHKRLRATLLGGLLTVALALVRVMAAEPPAALEQSIAYERYVIDYEIRADGTYVETGEAKVKLLTSGGVTHAGHFGLIVPVAFWDRAKKYKYEVLQARTLKADGRRIDAGTQTKPPENLPPGVPPPPFRFLSFPEVAVGDAIEYSYRYELIEPQDDKGVVLSQFFNEGLRYEDASVSVRAPAAMALHFDVSNVDPGQNLGDATTQHWVWKYRNEHPKAPATGFDLAGRGPFPHVNISTFADPQAEARAMQARMASALDKDKMDQGPKGGADGSVPADAAMRDGFPKTYARPVSDWQAGEKTRYQKILAAGRFDALVVPFQVQVYALDRATRSLMTAELTAALSGPPAGRLPDPYLVARALGEGNRHIDPDEVYRLADKMGVRRILWGYAGHDRHNQMLLTVQVQTRGVDGTLAARTPVSAQFSERNAFTDETPPIEVYETLLPRITTVLLGTSPAWPGKPVTANLDATEGDIPAEPKTLLATSRDPAHDALAFQLLAYLTPRAAERARERFAEKSWLAVQALSPKSPVYRVLRARALMLLGLRPAALRALGEAVTPEESELLAALNGNQPAAERFGALVRPALLHWIAALDVARIQDRYALPDKRREAAFAAALKMPGEVWPLLARRAFTDPDSWEQFDNIAWKRLLDRDFPIADYTLDSISRGAFPGGSPERLHDQQNLSVIHHVRMVRDIEAPQHCCGALSLRPGAWDYLDLIEATGEENLLRGIFFLVDIQGQPDRAQESLDRIASTFQGHPELAFAQARIQFSRAASQGQGEADGLRRAAYRNLHDAFFWSQGQTRIAARAFDALGEAPELALKEVGQYDNAYASDYPYRSFYPAWEGGGRPDLMQRNNLAALKNATDDIDPLRSYVAQHGYGIGEDGNLTMVFGLVENRFEGCTTVYRLKADFLRGRGDEAGAEQNLRDSIRVQPAAWDSYEDLGTLLAQQGRPDKAAEVFLAYPGFRPASGENPVGIANYAYGAGNLFFRAGLPDLTEKFYRLAANDTGAVADVVSHARLMLMHEDFEAAQSMLLDCAQHYDSTGCYEEYLELSFSRDDPRQAWDAFTQLTRQFDGSEVWEAALVGHRRGGQSEKEIIAWSRQQAERGAGLVKNRLAHVLLNEGVVDRSPSDALPAAVARVALPVWCTTGVVGLVVQPPFEDGPRIVQGPRRPTRAGTDSPPTPGASAIGCTQYAAAMPGAAGNTDPEKAPVKSSLVYLAEVENAIHLKDFVRAFRAANEAAAIYDLGDLGTEQSIMLPYLAYAAERSGNAEVAHRYLANFVFGEKGFNYYLAEAILAGIEGNPVKSIDALHIARNRRPYSDDRPVDPSYEYAQVCQWLFEATNRPEYQTEVLDWARAVGKLHPTDAWAHALVAIHSPDPAEKQRAIAMAHYLDPLSEWLKRIPAREREAATTAFKGRNPFLKKDPDRPSLPI